MHSFRRDWQHTSKVIGHGGKLESKKAPKTGQGMHTLKCRVFVLKAAKYSSCFEILLCVGTDVWMDEEVDNLLPASEQSAGIASVPLLSLQHRDRESLPPCGLAFHVSGNELRARCLRLMFIRLKAKRKKQKR